MSEQAPIDPAQVYAPKVGDRVLVHRGDGDTESTNGVLYYDHTAGWERHANTHESFEIKYVNANHEMTVMRIRSKNRVEVEVPGRGYGGGTTRLVMDPRNLLPAVQSDGQRIRRLGEIPTEGDHIAIDDPRILWIWDDLGKYASTQNWCGDYERLASRLNIPGRLKKFKAKATLLGFRVEGSVEARSQKEADNKFQAEVDDKRAEELAAESATQAA